MKEILILGPGCHRCLKLYDDVKSVVDELKLDCEIFKVTDINAIAGFGVMQTPALIIDGELKAAGKLLSKVQIIKLLSE
ncbi:MAG: thioredoxin family protein [bacterium]